jgi:hypothetical protein
MFVREISLLAEDERMKYKTRRQEFITHDGVLTKVEQFENACNNFFNMKEFLNR